MDRWIDLEVLRLDARRLRLDGRWDAEEVERRLVVRDVRGDELASDRRFGGPRLGLRLRRKSAMIDGTRKPSSPPMASVAPARVTRRLQTRPRRIDPPLQANVVPRSVETVFL